MSPHHLTGSLLSAFGVTPIAGEDVVVILLRARDPRAHAPAPDRTPVDAPPACRRPTAITDIMTQVVFHSGPQVDTYTSYGASPRCVVRCCSTRLTTLAAW